MPLSVRQIETLKPQEKPYKLADGGGLFLHITPTGNKSWRLKYRFEGKEKLMTFGLFPAITLGEARKQRDKARALLAAGVDPSEEKKSRKAESLVTSGNTFKSITLEWYDSRKRTWSEKYAGEMISMFDKDIFPFIGDTPITEIKPLMLLGVLRKFEERGAMERARKARRRCGEVFRYAIGTGRADYNPAPDLSIALGAPKPGHYPFLLESDLGVFNQALAAYGGGILVKVATQVLQLTGLRTVELRESRWSFIDFENAIWEIPPELMKSRRPHIVPMSRQVIALLEFLKPITGNYSYIFPGRSNKKRPISENSVLGVIKRIGFDGRASGHGFRHTMSTILNDHGFDSDLIERQLAHIDRNKVRGIYNHAQYLDKRREMMQWYADYLDGL
ncbi:tyrosine-type recombinase/integrase [Sodalis ligni]|uniref:tyrosine-type recombinase/integrase n=1 Tax=Sodalis ligni TaxID=2697027 RepID=UPI00193F4D24|nr:integrase arm-type DNA-binding domain-containing protein [Sodalis ligni]QWA09506.1 tyrosine-type recombinase/integrase [Sodalis ligni]